MSKKGWSAIGAALATAGTAGLAAAGNYFVNSALVANREAKTVFKGDSIAPKGDSPAHVTIRENLAASVPALEEWENRKSPQPVTIKAREGFDLTAFYAAGPQDSHRWAILVHGYHGSHKDARPWALAYAKWGFHCLLPDLRGHGQSGGEFVGMGWPDRLDMLGWIDWILEKDPARCRELAEVLPNAQIICGDCSDHALLEEQGVEDYDALVSLTGLDESNMIISLYASSRGVPQVITKISRSENSAIADHIALGSIICPRELCCNSIVRYVRAMQNQTGAAVSVHSIADGQAEAVEFLVDETTRNCGVPLKEMKLRPNVLVVNITRGTDTQIPGGDSFFQPGDTIVVVTSAQGALQQLNDIFA